MSRRPVTPPPKQRSGNGRTIILVAAAAVLAGLIIGRGLSNRGTTAKQGTGTTGGTGVTTPKTTAKAGTKGATTTAVQVATTAAQLVNLGSFTAIVLNGNGISGTAAARSTELNGLGVQVITAESADKRDYAVSQIYSVDAPSEAAARLLALKTGVGYGGGYPNPPPAPVAKLGKATIVLLLGKDIANLALTDKSGAAATTVATTAAAAPTTVKK